MAQNRLLYPYLLQLPLLVRLFLLGNSEVVIIVCDILMEIEHPPCVPENDEADENSKVKKSTKKNVKESTPGVSENDEADENSKVKKNTKKNVKESTPGVSENGVDDDDEYDDGMNERSKRSCRRGNVSYSEKTNKKSFIFDENGIKIDSTMCHQCQRNDKGRVFRCTKCKTKRFCVPYIGNW